MTGLRFRRYLEDARTLPRAVGRAWRVAGIAGAWDAVARRSVYRLARIGRYLVIEEPLADRLPDPPSGVTLRPLDDSTRDALAAAVPRAVARDFSLAAARGHLCFVAWRGDRVIGNTWLSERMDPALEFAPLPLPSDAVYLWGLYVVPAERRNGVALALMRCAQHWAVAHGYRRSWQLVTPGNRGSLALLRRTAGGPLRVAGAVRYVKLLDSMHARFIPG